MNGFECRIRSQKLNQLTLMTAERAQPRLHRVAYRRIDLDQVVGVALAGRDRD